MEVHSILFRVPRRMKDGECIYSRMARVWEYSVRLNSPLCTPVLTIIEDGDEDIVNTGREQTYRDNARKTRHHNQIVQQAKDGQLLCLMDCDTVVLGELSEVASREFDLAYTVRPNKSRFVFNSGVVFVRVSDRVRQFYRQWDCRVGELLPSMKRMSPKFGGINQTGLGYMLETDHGLNMGILDCQTWNYENTCLDKFLPLDNTKVVHFPGSGMKGYLNSRKRFTSRKDKWILPVVEKWREYEQAVSLQKEVA